MRTLKEVLALYKALLETEIEISVEVERTGRKPTIPSENFKPGDVVEIVPSYDNLEMVFLVLREVGPFFEIVPLSRFWEMATPHDVLVEVEGDTYIAQTDISFDVPKDNFSRRFGQSNLVKVGRLSDKELERVRKVADGEETGDGGMVGKEREEFKKFEARRWFAVFTSQIAEEEEIHELNGLLLSLKESSEPVYSASELEQFHGGVEGLEWFYDSEDNLLILVPEPGLVGKLKRIYIDLDGEKFVLFEGRLPEKLEIPVNKEAYSYKVLKGRLKLEDVQGSE